MSDDWTDNPDYITWEDRVRSELLPRLRESTLTVSLVTDGRTDVKFAVELGLSIMLNKPIIAVVFPGAPIPAKLLKVVDEIVEADEDSERTAERIHDAIGRIVGRVQ